MKIVDFAVDKDTKSSIVKYKTKRIQCDTEKEQNYAKM